MARYFHSQSPSPTPTVTHRKRSHHQPDPTIRIRDTATKVSDSYYRHRHHYHHQQHRHDSHPAPTNRSTSRHGHPQSVSPSPEVSRHTDPHKRAHPDATRSSHKVASHAQAAVSRKATTAPVSSTPTAVPRMKTSGLDKHSHSHTTVPKISEVAEVSPPTAARPPATRKQLPPHQEVMPEVQHGDKHADKRAIPRAPASASRHQSSVRPPQPSHSATPYQSSHATLPMGKESSIAPSASKGKDRAIPRVPSAPSPSNPPATSYAPAVQVIYANPPDDMVQSLLDAGFLVKREASPSEEEDELDSSSDDEEETKPEVMSEPEIIVISDSDEDEDAGPSRRPPKRQRVNRGHTRHKVNKPRKQREGGPGKRWTGPELEQLFGAATSGVTYASFEGEVPGRTAKQCYLTWKNTIVPDIIERLYMRGGGDRPRE